MGWSQLLLLHLYPIYMNWRQIHGPIMAFTWLCDVLCKVICVVLCMFPFLWIRFLFMYIYVYHFSLLVSFYAYIFSDALMSDPEIFCMCFMCIYSSAASSLKIPANTRCTIYICMIKIEISIKGLFNVPFCIVSLKPVTHIMFEFRISYSSYERLFSQSRKSWITARMSYEYLHVENRCLVWRFIPPERCFWLGYIAQPRNNCSVVPP